MTDSKPERAGMARSRAEAAVMETGGGAPVFPAGSRAPSWPAAAAGSGERHDADRGLPTERVPRTNAPGGTKAIVHEEEKQRKQESCNARENESQPCPHANKQAGGVERTATTSTGRGGRGEVASTTRGLATRPQLKHELTDSMQLRIVNTLESEQDQIPSIRPRICIVRLEISPHLVEPRASVCTLFGMIGSQVPYRAAK